jgi:adenylate kinase family enzyme
MTARPKCIIVTGRAGAGKTTLAKELGKRLWMPVISRDEIKEGYVNTFGVKHDELPSDTDLVVTNFFFEIVDQYLTNKISIIIEAAFQHKVWEPRMAKIAEEREPVHYCLLDRC